MTSSSTRIWRSAKSFTITALTNCVSGRWISTVGASLSLDIKSGTVMFHVAGADAEVINSQPPVSPTILMRWNRVA